MGLQDAQQARQETEPSLGSGHNLLEGVCFDTFTQAGMRAVEGAPLTLRQPMSVKIGNCASLTVTYLGEQDGHLDQPFAGFLFDVPGRLQVSVWLQPDDGGARVRWWGDEQALDEVACRLRLLGDAWLDYLEEPPPLQAIKVLTR